MKDSLASSSSTRSFVKNQSETSKIEELKSVTLLSETLHEVGDDNVENTPDSLFKKKSFRRRIKRRIKSFLRKPRFFKAKQDILEVQKFSMICMIGFGSSGGDVASPSPYKTFSALVVAAWELFIKLGGLFVQAFQNLPVIGNWLIEMFINHQYFIMYGSLVGCALFYFNHLAKKFSDHLKWYDRLFLIILSLIAAWLACEFFTSEAFHTILLWLKNLIFKIISMFRNRNNSVDLSTQDPLDPLDNAKSSKDNEFRVFLFYSVLSIATLKYLYYRFKRKLVGDGPLMHLIEMDIYLNDWIPLLGNR
jgi:hypothetical protein